MNENIEQLNGNTKTGNQVTNREDIPQVEVEKRKKGLQKLSKLGPVDEVVEDLLIMLLCDDKGLSKSKYENFNPDTKQLFDRIFENAIYILGYEDRDLFFANNESVLTEKVRRSLWEYNHVIIVNAIDSLTKNYNRFPSRREISTETGLSHQTINKHLKEYFNSNYFQDKKDEYLLLRESLLSKIYKFATEGNIKAARIFIDATTLMQPGICVKNQQNNFININGFNITQEQFKQLPEEQQTVLYEIIKMIPQALSKRVVSQFEF